MVVVFNSSSWIFLSKIGLIEPAIGLFSKVFLPSSVRDEVLSRGDEASITMEKLRAVKHIEVVGARNPRLVAALRRRLGKGEAEAITIALEREVDVVMTTQQGQKLHDLGYR